jgi:hypothetical protein
MRFAMVVTDPVIAAPLFEGITKLIGIVVSVTASPLSGTVGASGVAGTFDETVIGIG